MSLLGVEGLNLTVGPLDLVDGTPIFDIKPYLPRVDAFPASRAGWVEDVEAELATRERYQIVVEPPAAEQLAYLREVWQIDFTERAFGLLELDPTPHRTRRILQIEPNQFRMACGPWRIYYAIEDRAVHIQAISKGYADELFEASFADDIPERDAQLAFAERYRTD